MTFPCRSVSFFLEWNFRRILLPSNHQRRTTIASCTYQTKKWDSHIRQLGCDRRCFLRGGGTCCVIFLFPCMVYWSARGCIQGSELWREIALCLQPSPKFVYSCPDVLIKGSVYYDPIERRHKGKKKMMHRLKASLLGFDEHKINQDKEIDHHFEDGFLMPPKEVQGNVVMYMNRLYWVPETSESDILESGGLGGYWRVLATRRSHTINEEEEKVVGELFGEGPTAIKMQHISFNDDVPDIVQTKIHSLSEGRPDHVLAPLCILTERPLPATFSGIGCHDTHAEKIKWEIVPCQRSVVLSPCEIELLARFRLELFTLEAVTNFNIEAVAEDLSLGSSSFETAGVELKNLAPPFFLLCPFTLDGQSLDFNFVINNLRLSIMTISGLT